MYSTWSWLLPDDLRDYVLNLSVDQVQVSIEGLWISVCLILLTAFSLDFVKDLKFNEGKNSDIGHVGCDAV